MHRAIALRVPRVPVGVSLGLLLCWCAFLLMTTVNPDTGLGDGPFPGFDKVAHFGGWLVLGFLATLLVDDAQEQVAVWVACCLFGVLTELGQVPIPGRSFELMDAFADAVGAAVGARVCLRIGYKDAPPPVEVTEEPAEDPETGVDELE